MASTKRLPGYNNKPDFEQPSWEVFKACPKCLADEKKPCRRYAWSTRKIQGRVKSVILLGQILKNPHPGRKKFNSSTRPLGYRITW